MTTATQVKPGAVPALWLRLGRLLVVILCIALIGGALHRQGRGTTQSGEPAGFGRGVVDGALMPCTLPYLLAGMDLTIYAEANTGRGYKLGYTLGVNGCGALFFGFVFWRVNRLRSRSRSAAEARADSAAPEPVGAGHESP
jgi:hypothetical protein